MPEKTETVLINGRPLCYRVRKSRRARKMGLSVSSHEGVLVTLPWRVGFAAVPGLVNEYADWLDAQADKFDVRLGPRVRQYGSRSRVLVLGRPRTLAVGLLPANRSRPKVELTDDTLQMALTPTEIWDVRPALEKWLRRFARAELETRLAHWIEITGLVPKKVIVGDRKTRWGSCSSSGTLSFCYRLVMAPPDVVDAVVVHELCHLRYLDHGARFSALLDRYCPGHRASRRWLRDHHEDLQV